ncbi:hypothetical protein ARMSODRAFT_967008 [Armillaria solidipes]|uniref:Serine-threonine/tyrosine-protein kinase catalytic domain-containing protein n=1 Tax=Armillaria solidipes TaxID=1076256 RepID=A0A2H3AWW8_9AGAR|nr:hypothetical protein ARMSODRAFT_967008 [Armillaria solidipes]
MILCRIILKHFGNGESNPARRKEYREYRAWILSVKSVNMPSTLRVAQSFKIPNDLAFVNLVVRRKRRPSRPIEIADELWAVVTRCWSHEPGDRPTMESLNSDIKRIIRGKSAAVSVRSREVASAS